MDIERAEVKLLRRLHAVHLRHDTIPADAADIEAVEAQTGHVVLDIHPRFVLDEVGEGLQLPSLNDVAVDDCYRAWGLPHQCRPGASP